MVLWLLQLRCKTGCNSLQFASGHLSAVSSCRKLVVAAQKTTTCQDFDPRFLWTLRREWWEKGRTIFRGLLNPFGLYIIHWVAKYSVGKWLNCWGMKTCWGQHSSTAGCPRGVHARFGEGLMCIMMSTSRLTLTPIICIPYCTIKEITTAWWMVCKKGENSFPKWFWRNHLQLALMIFSLSDKHSRSHRWSQSYTS